MPRPIKANEIENQFASVKGSRAAINRKEQSFCFCLPSKGGGGSAARFGYLKSEQQLEMLKINATTTTQVNHNHVSSSD
jgi:hypothetical protein